MKWRLLLTALALPLLALFFIGYAKPYGTLLAPLFDGFTPLIYSQFDQLTVEIGKHKTEWVYRIIANNSQPISKGGMNYPANLQISSQTLLAHSVQHLLFYTAVLSVSLYCYPLSWRRLLAASVPLLLLLELIDIPFVLTGTIEDLLLNSFNQGEPVRNWRIIWMEFLTNGGRIGLAMAFAWLAVVFSQQAEQT